MKKYLMTGIAAVAMCAAFTSCSHDIRTPITRRSLLHLVSPLLIRIGDLVLPLVLVL